MRFLLHGSIGTGKSTELLGVLDQLREHHHVILLDLERHFDETVREPGALQRVQPWEVVFLTGLAVLRATTERWGASWAPALVQSFQSAVKPLLPDTSSDGEGTELDVLGLAKAVAVVVGAAAAGPAGAAVAAGTAGLAESALVGGVELLKALPDAIKGWTVPLGISGPKPIPEQDRKIARLLDATNALITQAQSEFQLPVVLLLDGLDKIRTRDANLELFVHSSAIASLEAHLVVAGSVLFQREALAPMFKQFQSVELYNIAVLDHKSPPGVGPDLDFFLEQHRLKVGDLRGGPECVPPDQVARLAWYSAGRSRDFAHLMQEVALLALEEDLDVATPEIVTEAIDVRRRLYEIGWNTDTEQVLRAVMEHPDVLPAEEGAERALEKLLDGNLLLPYPNEKTWWYPHTLLLRQRLRPATPLPY